MYQLYYDTNQHFCCNKTYNKYETIMTRLGAIKPTISMKPL